MDTWKINQIRSWDVFICFCVGIRSPTHSRVCRPCCRDAFLRVPMPRLSALPRPRESVFTGSHEFYRGDANAVCPPNLRECVLAMEDCCEEVTPISWSIGVGPHDKQAYEAQQLLRNGTFDLPRMTKVLQNQKVCFMSPLYHRLTASRSSSS